ncbi:hypothetical protein [uncultured Metabacillus sp.]|uniref:tetratricopeptide repeat protein n=1 Tax=uncultured Metabacillus sp. TaxID=2860135 RepID=UPI002609A2BF|nr:hypothetical protein [uncultured Metabacillus sp.]
MKTKKKYMVVITSIIVVLIGTVLVIDSGILTSTKTEKEISAEINESREEKIEMYEKVEGNISIEEKLEYGLLSSKNGEFDKAEQIYLEILEEDPNNLMATHRMGNLAIEENDFNKAMEYREKYVKLDPSNASGNLYYSQLLLLEDVNKSMQFAEKAFNLASEEEKSTFDSYNKVIKKIHSGDLEGYIELLKNDNLFIPENLKLAIINSVKKVHKEIPQELLNIQKDIMN